MWQIMHAYAIITHYGIDLAEEFMNKINTKITAIFKRQCFFCFYYIKFKVQSSKMQIAKLRSSIAYNQHKI